MNDFDYIQKQLTSIGSAFDKQIGINENVKGALLSLADMCQAVSKELDCVKAKFDEQEKQNELLERQLNALRDKLNRLDTRTIGQENVGRMN